MAWMAFSFVLLLIFFLRRLLSLINNFILKKEILYSWLRIQRTKTSSFYIFNYLECSIDTPRFWKKFLLFLSNEQKKHWSELKNVWNEKIETHVVHVNVVYELQCMEGTEKNIFLGMRIYCTCPCPLHIKF